MKETSPGYVVSELKNLFCTISLEGTVNSINQAGCDLVGKTETEILGTGWGEMFEEHSRSLSTEIIKQTKESGTWGGEILFQKSEGIIFPVFITTSLIVGKTDNLDYIAVLGTDITHKKQLEEIVRKRVELTSKIINNAPVGIVAFDRNGVIQIANKAFTDMIGVTGRMNILEKEFHEINPQLALRFNPLLERALEGNAINENNLILIDEEDSRLIVGLDLIPLQEIEGKIDGVLGLFEDRTEQAKMEERLIQADRLASMGFLAAGVAHEISNPLTGMYTIIEGFRDEARSRDDEDEPYERILSSIDRIKGIIGKLLAFANPSSQLPQLTQLNDLILNSVEFFKHQPTYRRIRIITTLDENLPSTVLDPNQITQVIHNLFINSAQAMTDGGEVRIRTSQKGFRILLEFEDTGCGIPKNMMAKIFDPFFTTKPPGQGTGLGLSVSYGIIKDHEGAIEIRSEEGEGTTFTISLPVKHESRVFDD